MTRNERAWKALGEFIRSQRRLANLSLRQMASLSTISNAYLSQVERGLYKPSAEVLKAIADALHLSVRTLYARVGFLEEEPEPTDPSDVEKAIRLDSRLSTEQKDALLHVYRSFVPPLS
jgi:transcriptional regulator with XRE-family HTH domain